MKTLIAVTIMVSLALVGCKKKPAHTPGDNPKPKSGAPMASTADAMKRVAAKPDERARPRQAGKTPEKLGTTPIAGLDRSAFVPADAIAYGAIDSKRLLAAAKPVLLAFAQIRAHKPGAKKAPKMDYAAIAAIGKKTYGIDIGKLGRVTLVVVAPEPVAGRRAAAFGEPVFLAPAAAFVPGGAKPVGKLYGVPLYAPAGKAKRALIAVVGKTVVFGPAGPVKKVIATGLGKAPRLQTTATLAGTIKRLRAAQPKASSYLIVDVAAVRARIKGGLGAWEKGLNVGGVFFTDQSLQAIVKGQPTRIAKLKKMAIGVMKMAALHLPEAKATLTKLGGAVAAKMLDDLAAALKSTTIKSAGDTFTLKMKGSPVKVMTAAGMLAYLMLARGEAKAMPPNMERTAAKVAKPKAAVAQPPMAHKPMAR